MQGHESGKGLGYNCVIRPFIIHNKYGTTPFLA